MIRVSRRTFTATLLSGLAVSRAPGATASTEAAQVLDQMVEALQGQSTIAFSAEIGASAGRTGLQTPGSSVDVVFERAGRLLCSFGPTVDFRLLVRSDEATLYRPSTGQKTELGLVKDYSAFSVPGLFLPFLGLLGEDVKSTMFGDVKSVTPIAQGTPEQLEPTDLVAVMGSLFTGEIWIRKSNSTPATIIGTFFDGADGAAESASITFSKWSDDPVTDAAFDVPGLSAAKSVPLHELGL